MHFLPHAVPDDAFYGMVVPWTWTATSPSIWLAGARGKLVLVASNTADLSDFIACLGHSCTVKVYDYETSDARSLTALVSDAVKGNRGCFTAIAVASHGGGRSLFALTKSLNVDLQCTSGPALDGVLEVMRQLGTAVGPSGRVDLFACQLLKTSAGQALFAKIGAATATHFAASSNLTGNVVAGGGQDWLMESDATDVSSIYFGRTDAFDANFSSGGNRSMGGAGSADQRLNPFGAGPDADLQLAGWLSTGGGGRGTGARRAGGDAKLELAPSLALPEIELPHGAMFKP